MTADTPSRNPYLFVVGCPRSGTTLLQRMLDHHPDVAVTNDTHFIPRILARETDPNPRLTDDLVARTREYRRFRRLGLDEAAVEAAAAGAADYAAFVARLYDAVGRAAGKPLAGEKTPDYVRNLPLLHDLFPAARFVHIIRDGRDVALSVREWATPTKGPGKIALWDEEPVAVCALWWRRNVAYGRRDGPALGPGKYREVRYEKLVEAPEDELRGLAAFLDLPYAPEMAAFHAGRTRDEPGLSAKSAWLPATSGLRDWRQAMPERDVALFEALAGDLLDELGCERAHPRIPDEVARTAERCRAWWDRRSWHRASGSRTTTV